MRNAMLVACLLISGTVMADNPAVITFDYVTRVEGNGTSLTVYSRTLPGGVATYHNINGAEGTLQIGEKGEIGDGGHGKRFHFRNEDPCETLVIAGTFNLSGGAGGEGTVIPPPANFPCSALAAMGATEAASKRAPTRSESDPTTTRSPSS